MDSGAKTNLQEMVTNLVTVERTDWEYTVASNGHVAQIKLVISGDHSDSAEDFNIFFVTLETIRNNFWTRQLGKNSWASGVMHFGETRRHKRAAISE